MSYNFYTSIPPRVKKKQVHKSNRNEIIDVFDSDEERKIKNRSDEKKMEKVKKKKKRKRSGEKQKPRKKLRRRKKEAVCKNPSENEDCLGVATTKCPGCRVRFCGDCADGALEFQCELCQTSFCEKCFKNKMLTDCGECSKSICSVNCGEMLNHCDSCGDSFCPDCGPVYDCEYCGQTRCSDFGCCEDDCCKESVEAENKRRGEEFEKEIESPSCETKGCTGTPSFQCSKCNKWTCTNQCGKMCVFCRKWACSKCACCIDKSCLLTGKCSGDIEKLF